jgi:hypothetical protein
MVYRRSDSYAAGERIDAQNMSFALESDGLRFSQVREQRKNKPKRRPHRESFAKKKYTARELTSAVSVIDSRSDQFTFKGNLKR